MRTTDQATALRAASHNPDADKCAARVGPHYHARIGELRALWHAYTHAGHTCRDCVRTGRIQQALGCEYCTAGTYSEDSPLLHEYGLSFDYVPPGTFNRQRRGYWRYQLSWGGPSDEFRFYADENRQLTRIEYWFLDWFDGARVRVTPHSRNGRLLGELWEWFSEMGSVEAEYTQAMEDA